MSIDTSYPELRATLRLDTAAALAALYELMQPDVTARFDAGAKTLIAQRWVDRLTQTIQDRHMVTAEQLGAAVAAAMSYTDFDPTVMQAWLAVNAESVASAVTTIAEEEIRAKAETDKDTEDAPHPVAHIFDSLINAGASSVATSLVTTGGNFVARDVAEKAGASGKVWHTTSAKPRKAHARVNGETVGIAQRFSNGMHWPGDPAGGPAELANCKCTLKIIK